MFYLGTINIQNIDSCALYWSICWAVDIDFLRYTLLRQVVGGSRFKTLTKSRSVIKSLCEAAERLHLHTCSIFMTKQATKQDVAVLQTVFSIQTQRRFILNADAFSTAGRDCEIFTGSQSPWGGLCLPLQRSHWGVSLMSFQLPLEERLKLGPNHLWSLYSSERGLSMSLDWWLFWWIFVSDPLSQPNCSLKEGTSSRWVRISVPGQLPACWYLDSRTASSSRSCCVMPHQLARWTFTSSLVWEEQMRTCQQK